MYRERIKKLKNFLKSENLDALLVNQRDELKHTTEIRYLCGFTGDTGLMV